MSDEKYVTKYNHKRLNNEFHGVFDSWDFLWVLFCGLLIIPGILAINVHISINCSVKLWIGEINHCNNGFEGRGLVDIVTDLTAYHSCCQEYQGVAGDDRVLNFRIDFNYSFWWENTYMSFLAHNNNFHIPWDNCTLLSVCKLLATPL